MTIKKKLYGAGLIFFIAFISFAAVNTYHLKQIKQDFSKVKDYSIKGKVALLEINRDVNYVSRLTRNIMLGSDYEKDLKKLKERIKSIEDAYTRLENTALHASEAQLIQRAKKSSLDFVYDGLRHVQKLRTVPADERHLSYADYNKTATPLAIKSRETFPKVIELKNNQTDAGLAHVQSSINSQLMLNYFGTPVLLSFISVIFLILARAIGTPVKQLRVMAEAISQGDLDVRINLKSRDEMRALAEAMNEMANALGKKAELAVAISKGDLTRDVEIYSDKDRLGYAYQEMFESLNNSLAMVNSASNQIDMKASEVEQASQALSQGATQSAASLEQISSSLSELSSQTNLNADNAKQVNNLSSEAKKVAQEGNNKMNQMVSAMDEIRESSQRITNIIKVIDEIAFQTNLLALNAAVEAARAGQHGKGFAVVAEEVRNLASRSAKAAAETSELIAGSAEKTRNGADIAEETSKFLQRILQSVSKVSDLAEEIALASSEQAEGISQINQGLGQIDSVVQQNTATAEQSASAAEELSSQASDLNNMLSRFHLKQQGSEVYSKQGRNHTPIRAGFGGKDNQLALDITSA